jgi:hypothetical protein
LSSLVALESVSLETESADGDEGLFPESEFISAVICSISNAGSLRHCGKTKKTRS